MNITALAPWYGSKRTLAARIIHQLGPHSVYWEPFCGSMAVLLAKDPSRQETVNDLHNDLINLARIVADPKLAPDLEWRLRRTLVHEGLYRETVTWLKDPAADQEGVERAYRYFVRSWMGMNGVAGTSVRSNFARRFTSNGGCPAVRFAAAVDSLPWWHQRLRTVAIYQGDGIDLCTKVEDKAGTVIYLDPPYLKKSDDYQHDFTDPDHARLATAIGRFKHTRCVVSYYDHPKLAELYPGWGKIAIPVHRAMANASRSMRGTAPEVLLVNQPPITQTAKEAA
ncbi:D12 class N6 adenine-specific DNA methyltransferase [Gemmata sp. SH-PL17]|uniref:DNA adenine methylase n=1 Tax=Gemmata sp. SH-PL17 TaxID=1630693 RepID=UPI00078CFA93|nr:DNA adenine methylase [Gemmata sp. SH-PL17]AMV24561.1 D12 class N6 adenine-specific DNA methyltransferase [Gemmata sp. SH-PL17]